MRVNRGSVDDLSAFGRWSLVMVAYVALILAAALAIDLAPTSAPKSSIDASRPAPVARQADPS
jgi:hypothetical protein